MFKDKGMKKSLNWLKKEKAFSIRSRDKTIIEKEEVFNKNSFLFEDRKKIFISHRSLDYKVVNIFSRFLTYIGVKQNEYFC